MPARELDIRLLDAAEQLIVRGGFERLSPEAVARGAGLAGDDAVPDPPELFTAVILRDEDRFNAIVDKALAETGSASRRLLTLIEACVVDYDWSLWIELWSLALREEWARQVREPLDEAWRKRIAAVVEDGRDSGEFHVGDAGPVALAIATLIEALAVEATLGDDTVSPNFMLDACSSVTGELVGAELKLRDRPEHG